MAALAHDEQQADFDGLARRRRQFLRLANAPPSAAIASRRRHGPCLGSVGGGATGSPATRAGRSQDRAAGGRRASAAGSAADSPAAPSAAAGRAQASYDTATKHGH